MSGKIPKERRRAPDRARLEEGLRQLIEANRELLFEPFKAYLESSPRLADETSRIVASLQVFFNKWTVEVVVVLSQHRALRFNEMRGLLEGISGRTLSQRLKELEDQGLVRRSLLDERPVRVEYALTPKGLDVAYLALPLVLYLRTQQP